LALDRPTRKTEKQNKKAVKVSKVVLLLAACIGKWNNRECYCKTIVMTFHRIVSVSGSVKKHYSISINVESFVL